MINFVASKLQSGSAFWFGLSTFSLLAVIASTTFLAGEACCAQVTLAWSPSSAPNLAGYKIYYGTASRNYSSVINAGSQTTATVTGLTSGATYYFAATAYNTSGIESVFSNEAPYTAPSSCSYTISPATASFTAAGGTGSISVNASVACTWAASTPPAWITISSGGSGTGNGTVAYSVSANAGSASRTATLTIAGMTFTVTQAATSTPGSYVGCYTDSSTRALPVVLSTGGDTVESCVQKAAAAGYAYAGLQWYGECYAGNTAGYTQVADSQCNTACSANSAEMCGGSWRNSIYSTGASALSYVGCYTDSSTRALPVVLSTGGETVESCTAKAAQAGYTYAGVQYYGECWAGNTVGYSKVADSECNMPCTANTAEMCGGSWRNSIYRAR